MRSFALVKLVWVIASVVTCIASGCGTTHWTDTRRTATEQLLVSDAIDRAVNKIDFRPLRGKKVYLDAEYQRGVVDDKYLISSLRQSVLASGCILKEKRDDATYVIEARAGVIGTDRHDLLYGVPATNVPSFMPVPGLPSSIPEIPIAKRTNQRAVAKIAVFAYNRETGVPVWQSGIANGTSRTNNIWMFGAGPFQRGTIYDGTAFAGQTIKIPLVSLFRRKPKKEVPSDQIDVRVAKVFPEQPPSQDRNGGATGLAGEPVGASADRQAPGKLEPLSSARPPQSKSSSPIHPSSWLFPLNDWPGEVR